MKKFEQLGINNDVLKVIKEEKFEEPTEIQEKSIPLVVKGKDIVAGSATGSGKTLAFGAGIIQNSKKGAGIQALVMTPTRELAVQVAKEIKKFSKYNHLDTTSVYGGVSINHQIARLKKCDVVVGTPGRILDHIERNTINLSHVKILVLDEADRMLDMGFIDDVEKIIRQCPKQRQTMLFSATISADIDKLCHRYMNNPTKISAESYVDPSKLKQIYFDSPYNMKFSLLVHLLKKEREGLVMVFCNTRRNTDFVAKSLKPNGINAMAIHGGFTQQKRTKTMDNFHSKNVHVLVCTDVAARGLDIKDVSHIYNYDIPKDSKEYIHRVGRTARAGKKGKVVNIVSDRDYENFSKVLSDHQIKIEKEKMPHVERAKIIRDTGRRPGKFSRGPGGGRGPARHSGGYGGAPRRHGGPSRGHGESRGRSGEGGLTRSERRARGL